MIEPHEASRKKRRSILAQDGATPKPRRSELKQRIGSCAERALICSAYRTRVASSPLKLNEIREVQAENGPPKALSTLRQVEVNQVHETDDRVPNVVSEEAKVA